MNKKLSIQYTSRSYKDNSYLGIIAYRLWEWIVCVCVCVLVTQSCPTLSDPMDRSPPGLSVHGILKTRILDWVTISFSSVNFSSSSVVAKSSPTLATPQSES